MWNITTNYGISAYSAEEQSDEYAAPCVLSPVPSDIWRATSQNASLFVVNGSSIDAIGIFNTNAKRFNIHVFPDETGENLVSNGGFEIAGDGCIFDGWAETAGDGSITDETSDVHAGAHAAKLTAGSTASTKITREISSGFTPGSRVMVSAWTKGDGSNAGRWSLEYYNGSSWTNLVATRSTNIIGTAYTRAHMAAHIPSDAAKLRITFMCPAVSSGIAYFDDVAAREAVETHAKDLGAYDTITEIVEDYADHGLWNTFQRLNARVVGANTVEMEIQTAEQDPVYVGVVFAGRVRDFSAHGPVQGVSMERKHNSTEVVTEGGGFYGKNRGKTMTPAAGIEITLPSVIKIFSGALYAHRDLDRITFMESVYGVCGPLPSVWVVDPRSTVQDYYTVLGRLTLIRDKDELPQYARIEWTITEVR